MGSWFGWNLEKEGAGRGVKPNSNRVKVQEPADELAELACASMPRFSSSHSHQHSEKTGRVKHHVLVGVSTLRVSSITRTPV